MNKKISLGRVLRRDYPYYLLILPAVILTIVFSYVPLSGWIIAFMDYKIGLPLWESKWIGLKAFIDFFTIASDAGFVIRNTVVINLLCLLTGISIPCIFALLLNEIKHTAFKRLVQSASFFPFFISWVVAYSIFVLFLGVNDGMVNIALTKLGLINSGINFLGDANMSWGLIVFGNLWKCMGYNSVIYIAAISGIDTAVYESADIDGANRFQKSIYITLPSLMDTIVIILILNLATIFGSNFDMMYLFMNSTNRPTMNVLSTYIYNIGLRNLDFSYSTAVTIVMSAINLIMLFVVNKIAGLAAGKRII